MPNLHHPYPRRHQPGQVVYELNPHPASDSKARGPGFDTRPATYFRFSFRWFKKDRCQLLWKYVHEVLVNRLGGLSLPKKSVGRLTDRPDMTIDVYRGRNTTT